MILNFPGVDYEKIYELAAELRTVIPVSTFLDDKKIGKQIEYAVRGQYDYIAILGEEKFKRCSSNKEFEYKTRNKVK